MSTDQPTPGRVTHVDLVTLADLDEGLLGRAAEFRVRAHLAGCPECTTRLASVAGVRVALAGATVETMPASVAARIDASLAAAELLPPVVDRPEVRTGRKIRWRPSGGLLAGGAAASIVLLLFGALVLGALRDGGGSRGGSNAGAAKSATGPQARAPGVVSASGRNYNAKTLHTAVAELLSRPGALVSGSARAAGDAKAGAAQLPDPVALDRCVAELAGRPGVSPLAVDLGRYAGRPAQVVVLPEAGRSPLLDVWVVRPGCTRGDPQLLYFTRLPRPSGIPSP